MALLWLALGAMPLLRAQYQTALPGYRYEFPRDHFNHPQFQTEWWYYTGNLKAADGHRFGFELTFLPAGCGPWRACCIVVVGAGFVLRASRAQRSGWTVSFITRSGSIAPDRDWRVRAWSRCGCGMETGRCSG